MTVLGATQLRFSYPETQHRKSLELQVDEFVLRENQIAVIIGPNSAGKSTLCKLLAKVIEPDKGHVDCYGNPPVLVWQDGELFPGSVEKNLRLAARRGRTRLQCAREVTRLAEALDLNVHLTVSQLSGGAQQRLAIARALAATDRRVRIFDEPTRSLDANYADAIVEHIKSSHERNRDGGTIVVTHDARLLMLLNGPDVVTYTLELSDGARGQGKVARLEGPTPSSEFIERPPTGFAAGFLGYENVFGLNNPKQGITLKNLLSRVENGAGSFCVIPPSAIRIVAASDYGVETAEITRSEFRSGGIRVIRCKWGQGIELVAFDRRSLNCGGADPTSERRRSAAGRIGLVIEEQKCLKRDASTLGYANGQH